MKRSEMVKYLTKLLNTFEDCTLGETEASEILEGLEHMGMMPPEIESDIYIRSECMFAMVNKWEKE